MVNQAVAYQPVAQLGMALITMHRSYHSFLSGPKSIASVPALLRNRLSGYATGHLVKHPDRGWTSEQNIKYYYTYAYRTITAVLLMHVLSIRLFTQRPLT